MDSRAAARAARINKEYAKIISGSTPIAPHNGSLFLEALYTNPEPVDCITNLVASKSGLEALQAAIRYDLSPKFLNSHGSAVLKYLQNDNLKVVNNGLFLNDILLKIVNPPIFWSEFRKSFLKGELNEEAVGSFGWLLLQLCMLAPDHSVRYRQDTDMQTIIDILRSNTSQHVKALADKIEEILSTAQSTVSVDKYAAIGGPGGRHDNDFSDFRKISILPTGEELLCKAEPFLRPSSVLEDPDTEPARVAIHLDNQFRLLREDMIYEMREEIQVSTGQKKGFRRGFKIEKFILLDIDFGTERKPTDWGLICQCKEDLPQLKGFKTVEARKKYLLEKRNFIKHQSLACLLVGKDIVAFPTISRDEDRLAKNPPEIVLQFEDAESTKKALYRLKIENDVTLIQIDTAVFAYEPTLKALQQATTLPLSSELLLWKEGDILEEIEDQPTAVVQTLRNNPQQNLRYLLGTATDIRLDASQAQSLISGLTQKISLIQGPPGTGKSFIGALLAKAIHDHTEQRILVVCYTNHALDDILTSLLDIGIPEASMVRLGGKSTARTEPLTLQNQGRSGRSRADWTIIDELKSQLPPLVHVTTLAFKRYNSSKVDFVEMLDYLEVEGPPFFEAFSVPESQDGMQIVGSDGKAIGPDYLIERWSRGLNAGPFKSYDLAKMETSDGKNIWGVNTNERKALVDSWKDALLREAIDAICDNAREYNRCQQRLSRAFKSDTADILRTKRVVGCTTTAAAKYREDMQAFNPHVLLVEEAGEILESHVLTSLGPETSQMILIGDHKQLRPKVNNYTLTVEKGNGYDLNRSLFERLILRDYPHQTLSQQHRMRPEISALIRNLTYPDLVDAAKTRNRPDLQGVQDNIVFIHHENLEDANNALADKNDMGSASSKQNSFEIAMILKIVRYLAQQGYGTEKLVILTPYLGQLQKLRAVLKDENDPILNDLDSAELIRAGVFNPSEAKKNKNPIHLATIDNYQGEESDIVVVSLTRSNPQCDIGFMFSPERLNVLLSRARNAMIMIGNMNTFKNARKGKELWQKLFGLLGQGKHIYDGFPVKCQHHPGTMSILETPSDFDTSCPDGGCTLPCGTKLVCGHACPSRCHEQTDHSKTKCKEMKQGRCVNNHPRTWECNEGPPESCASCDRQKKLAKEKLQQELAIRARQEADQRAHLAKMDALNTQIAQERREQEQQRLVNERANAIRQREAELAIIQRAKYNMSPVNSPATPYPPSLPSPASPRNSVPSVPLLSPSSQTGQTSPTVTPPQNAPVGSSILGNLSKMWGTVSSAIQPIIKASQKAQTPGKHFKHIEESPSEREWQRLKKVEGANDDAIDELMAMTGLEAIKDQVLKIKAKIDTSIRQQASIQKDRFNVVFLGNPGTGKTTVARRYAKFLANAKVVPGPAFVETTGARLGSEGVALAQKLVAQASGGGAIFIDEAYQLTNGNNPGGPAVLDFLLAEMENNVGTIVFILAGYNKEMEKFFEHNPGLKSRVPYQFNFDDYKDEELMAMFVNMIFKRYNGRMAIQDGAEGLYSRILIRRLGRRRGQPGFGNARDLEQTVSRICERQAARLTKARKEGQNSDDFFMHGEDLIGPNPTDAIKQSEAWKKLHVLIGLKAVKDSVGRLFHLIEENYKRELLEQEPMEISLNRVFLGSPGTGKTTVAKIYGRILADLGLLTNGEVIIKNPSDFVGAHLGASEVNTKSILANAVGKVLIIDEAYMLYGGGGKNKDSGGGNSSNQFKTSVIDTIVAEVQNVPGEDRCVLMLGYKDQMMEMFQNVNPGLSRRFKIEEAFNFEDFSDAELRKILDMKLKQGDLDATDAAKTVALEILGRMRNRPNFGNAGEVENLITHAKERCVGRRANMAPSDRPKDIVFEPQDFDPEFNRAATAVANLVKLFDDVVGRDDVITKLKNYQEISIACKKQDKDPREFVPMNFVFTGPPGTGKTTIARKMGHVYYDMGILGSEEVVECSASDLVGQYVGQTGPKTRTLFEKALGKVLFIDEAYRLSGGHFAQEAIDELVGLLTHPTFKSKLIVILAGYEDDINRLLSVNQGLSSRFPDQIMFSNMDADSCLNILRNELQKNKVKIDNLEDGSSAICVEMKERIRDFSELKDWGNARDMITLSKELVSRSLLLNQNLAVGADANLPTPIALDVVEKMLEDRRRRNRVPAKTRKVPNLPVQNQTPIPPTPPSVGTSTTSSATPPPPPSPSATTPQTPRAETPTTPSHPRQGTPNQAPNRDRRRRGPSNAQNTLTPAQPSTPRHSRPSGPNNAQRTPAPAPAPNSADAGRDPGVSDAVWAELNAAKRATEQAAQLARNVQREVERKIAEQKRAEEAQRRRLREIQQALAAEQEAAAKAALQRQLDEARRREQAAWEAKQRALAELRAKQEVERRRQEKEQRAQQKLREMGVCIQGYQWQDMGSYYRCRGGAHTVSRAALGL